MPRPDLRDEHDPAGLWMAAAAHLVVALFMFQGAITSLGQRVVGSANTETMAFLWSHFCVRHYVLDRHQIPYHIDLLDHPVGGTLWVKDSLTALLMIPVQLIAGIPVAFTTSGVLLFLLAGVGSYLLARTLGLGRSAAVLGSMAFAWAPHNIGEAYNGNMEALATGWMPLWLWAMLRTQRRPTVGAGIVAGLLLFALLYNNQYFGMAMAPASLVVLLIESKRRWADGDRLRRAAILGLALLLGGLLFSPFAYTIRASFAAPDNLALVGPARQLVPPYVTDLLHLVRPLCPLDGYDSPTPFQDIVYPGILILVLAVASPWLGPRGPWRWCWASLALGFLVLSLGPAVAINGFVVGAPDDVIYLPWAYVVSGLPGLEQVTLPHRMAVPAALFLALGMASTVEGITRRWSRYGYKVALSLGLAALFEVGFYPPYKIPLTTMETPLASHATLLRNLDQTGGVLNLPLYLGSNPRRVYFWYQTQHERPIDMAIKVGPPPSIFGRVPLLESVVDLQGTADGGRPFERIPPEPDDPMGAAALAEEDYAVVVLHGDLIFHTRTPRAAPWVELLGEALGDGLALDDNTVIYPLGGLSLAKLEEEAIRVLPAGSVLGRISDLPGWPSPAATPTARRRP